MKKKNGIIFRTIPDKYGRHLEITTSGDNNYVLSWDDGTIIEVNSDPEVLMVKLSKMVKPSGH